MHKLRYAHRILCFCILFVFCGEFFRYLLVDDTSSYTRIMMHELYHQKTDIHILFAGSSHCYRSFIPQILDDNFGKNTFNGGSSAQELDGSMQVIREAVKNYRIEQIYLELYCSFAFMESYKERSQMTGTYILSDYMKPSVQKFRYLWNASSKKHYINSFIPARRNWKNLFDLDVTYSLIKRKLTKDYRNYGYAYVTNDQEAYMGKGFVANKTAISKGTFWASKNLLSVDLDKLSEDWKKSLFEIIDFCKDKNIGLTLVSAPMPVFLLFDMGNYDDYIELVNQMIEGTGIKYYDFNLCREEYIPDDSSLFMDLHHLNYDGAKLFSKVFADFFTGKITEEELFYSSYKEKCYNMQKKIFGVMVEEDMEEQLVEIKAVTNSRKADITYFVTKRADAKKAEEIVKKGTAAISYSDGEHGVLDIKTYLSGEENNHICIEYGQ